MRSAGVRLGVASALCLNNTDRAHASTFYVLVVVHPIKPHIVLVNTLKYIQFQGNPMQIMVTQCKLEIVAWSNIADVIRSWDS